MIEYRLRFRVNARLPEGIRDKSGVDKFRNEMTLEGEVTFPETQLAEGKRAFRKLKQGAYTEFTRLGAPDYTEEITTEEQHPYTAEELETKLHAGEITEEEYKRMIVLVPKEPAQ